MFWTQAQLFGLLVFLGYMTDPTRSECCGFVVANCELGGAAGFGPCCAYGGLGSCNVFCCNCDEECIERGCGFSLIETTFSNASRMEEVQVSERIPCNGTETCKLSVPINKVFEGYFSRPRQADDVRIPVKNLISDSFSDSYKDSVAEKTKSGEKVDCIVSPGHEVWLGQEPRFAVLSSKYVYTCCNGASCWEDKEKSGSFQYQMPIVRANGVIDSNVVCHEEPLEGWNFVDEPILRKNTSGSDSGSAEEIIPRKNASASDAGSAEEMTPRNNASVSNLGSAEETISRNASVSNLGSAEETISRNASAPKSGTVGGIIMRINPSTSVATEPNHTESNDIDHDLSA